jgi:hypothetical protein
MCLTERTGKTFEGPKVTASRKNIFSGFSSSSSYLLPIIIGVGALVFLYKTSEKAASLAYKKL